MSNTTRVVHSRLIFLLTLIIGLSLISPALDAQQKVTSPEEFFGFQLGSDRNIARWDKIVEYYFLLEKESDKLKVINMGP